MRGTYRDYQIVSMPPPSSGGVHLIEMLNVLEGYPLADLGCGSVPGLHLMIETMRRAYADRAKFLGDTDFVHIPSDLTTKGYAKKLAATIDLTRAAEITLADPERASGDTTYFCVVDAEGNAVSGIQSLNSLFGSGVTAGDTGILLNNRMAYWHLAEGHANRLAPGKRVRHTMNAPMVFQEGKLWAVEGTPGADNQVQVNLQVLVAMMDFGADPVAALEAPRWTSSQRGQGANWPHEGDELLTIEPGFGADVLKGLERLGHRLDRVGPLEGPCSVQAIRLMPNGIRMAGSDPRRDGWAAAY